MAEVAALELDGISVSYDGNLAVDAVSLLVYPGEVVAVLGPNGAGRTSLLRAAVGLAPQVKGRVLLGGVDVSRRSTEWRSRAGLFLIPEDRGLIPMLTVHQHMRLASRRKPTGEEEEAVFDVFPVLRERAKLPASQLSGGEAQMLSLSMALLAAPKVLLVDEVSLGLAPMIVARLLQLCRELAKDRGWAVVLVEQYVEQALEVADRALVMSRGSLMWSGSSEELGRNGEVIVQAYLGSDKSQ